MKAFIFKLITILIHTKLQQLVQSAAADSRHAAQIMYNEQVYFGAGRHQHTGYRFRLNV